MTVFKFIIIGFLLCVTVSNAKAEDSILHIYSSRHYNTDEALYKDFTKQTGIKVQRVDGKGDALIARLEQEGETSPADLFITVDAGRLWRAKNAGLFKTIDSKILAERIPAELRDKDSQWFGLSKRARVIAYNRHRISKDSIANYEDLTKADFKNRVCIRTSSNIYNLSLMASMIAIDGAEKAQQWAEALQQNLARKPQGGDTDQLKAIAAGICDVAIVNSYYYYRFLKSDKDSDQKLVADIDILYPNQDTTGTHINISGAGVLKHADNPELAIQFLEYLTSDEAQKYFADGNNEYPVVQDINGYHSGFKAQAVHVDEFGKNQQQAMMIFDLIKFP